jgi:hypothetical protein
VVGRFAGGGGWGGRVFTEGVGWEGGDRTLMTQMKAKFDWHQDAQDAQDAQKRESFLLSILILNAFFTAKSIWCL